MARFATVVAHNIGIIVGLVRILGISCVFAAIVVVCIIFVVVEIGIVVVVVVAIVIGVLVVIVVIAIVLIASSVKIVAIIVIVVSSTTAIVIFVVIVCLHVVDVHWIIIQDFALILFVFILVCVKILCEF